jgi:hypothetical protein
MVARMAEVAPSPIQSPVCSRRQAHLSRLVIAGAVPNWSGAELDQTLIGHGATSPAIANPLRVRPRRKEVALVAVSTGRLLIYRRCRC